MNKTTKQLSISLAAKHWRELYIHARYNKITIDEAAASVLSDIFEEWIERSNYVASLMDEQNEPS
jgi:hypothetical protein